MSWSTVRASSVCAGVLAMAMLAVAEEPADKSGYWLFNPVPVELMRELSPDRPDTTESPYSVDAGHFQLEASFLEYAHDDEDGVRSEAWTVMDTNLKLGLTNSSDIQFVFGAYGEESSHGDGPDERVRGFSDLTIRYKQNLWGNDGGTRTAFALMPFVTIPTGTDLSTDKAEGGLIMPLGFDLAEGIGAAVMAEIDAVYDDEEDNYDAEFVHTATVGFGIVGPLGAFVEYVGIISSDSGSGYQAYFNTGLTYGVNENVLLDIGVRLGLNDASEDVSAFTGITFRH